MRHSHQCLLRFYCEMSSKNSLNSPKFIIYCFVPKCKNNSGKDTNKQFFALPQESERRKNWQIACNREEHVSANTHAYLCEDHFNLPEDLENWYQYSLVPNTRAKFKKSALPSRFECQNKKIAPPPRVASLQRARKRLVKDLLTGEGESEDVSTAAETQTGESSAAAAGEAPQVPDSQPAENAAAVVTPLARPAPSHRDVGVQAKPKFRSKETQVSIRVKDQAVSPLKGSHHTPVKKKLVVDEVYSPSEATITPAKHQRTDEDSDPSYKPSSDECDSDTELINAQIHSLSATRYWNKNEPMFYLGVPKESYSLVKLLAEKIKYRGNVLEAEDIVTLILRKIRLDITFKAVSHSYGISESHATKLFTKHLHTVAKCMKSFVRMLHEDSVYANLPLGFFARYSDVYIIIDTFEIEIEQPSNAFDQSESYSMYKKCNTLKILIGCSPDGVIMFISEPFLGRNSDKKITEVSEFVSKIPRGKSVMADRGFKNLETALHQRGCRLVRPPSTSNGEKFSKTEADITKKVAALRIHVERCIRRCREFLALKLHAQVHHSLTRYMSDIVLIASGLVNLQPPLTKI